MLLRFNFSKAFDTVYYVMLLKILPPFGLSKPVIRWIAFYLTGREQAVIDNNNQISSFLKLNMGVSYSILNTKLSMNAQRIIGWAARNHLKPIVTKT